MIGASSGSDDNLAKLVRLKPSDAMERTSKLHRLIECRDPLGASFTCGVVVCNNVSFSMFVGESNIMTKCVGDLCIWTYMKGTKTRIDIRKCYKYSGIIVFCLL